MKGLRIKIEKNRVVEITDDQGNTLPPITHITIDLDSQEFPRVMLDMQPEFIDIEMTDSLLIPEVNDETFAALAAQRGYQLQPRCDDETSDVEIEQELHSEDQNQGLSISRISGPGGKRVHGRNRTIKRR